jgi:hypothetical protein
VFLAQAVKRLLIKALVPEFSLVTENKIVKVSKYQLREGKNQINKQMNIILKIRIGNETHRG